MIRISALLILILVSCSKKEENEKYNLESRNMADSVDDLKIPQNLWEDMEKIHRPMAFEGGGEAPAGGGHGEAPKAEGHGEAPAAEGHGEAPAAEGHGEAPEGGGHSGESGKTNVRRQMPYVVKKKPPLEPVELKIWLIEKTPGVLGGTNYELSFPVGGGKLDLKNFVSDKVNGTFFFKAVFEAEMEPSDLKVFFVSKALKRKVAGMELGAGCRKYMDISDYWKKISVTEGLMLNTLHLRHLSVAGGTLYFVWPYQGKLRISHLEIKDSRYPKVFCNSGEES